MRNVTEIQRWLIGKGYLSALDENGKPNDDGTFGTRTLAAYNRARAAKGKKPHEGVLLLVEINADLFPEEQPAASPPTRKPGAIDVLALITNIVTSKGKPMKWSTIEQLIRIGAYTVGSALLGQQIADGQMFQAALAGILPVAAFLWWLVFERNRPKAN